MLSSLAIAISIDASADFTNRPRPVAALRNGASGFWAISESRALSIELNRRSTICWR